jgi:hypothetical protein
MCQDAFPTIKRAFGALEYRRSDLEKVLEEESSKVT